jgi:hypothetical protein
MHQRISTALAHTNPTQCTILEANYGHKDVEAEGHVKEIFCEVSMDAYYTEYEVDGGTTKGNGAFLWPSDYHAHCPFQTFASL